MYQACNTGEIQFRAKIYRKQNFEMYLDCNTRKIEFRAKIRRKQKLNCIKHVLQMFTLEQKYAENKYLNCIQPVIQENSV